MRPSETRRVLKEAARQAQTQGRSAASYSGPQKAAPVHAGTNVGGEWVPYGRVGITPIGAPFRARGE